MGGEFFELSLLNLTGAELELAARAYAEQGVIVLRDVGPSLVAMFERALSLVMGDLGLNLPEIVDGSTALASASPEARKKVSQIRTTPDTAHELLSILEPILQRILGPVVHVSRDFHSHFKGGAFPQTVTGYGGYPTGTKYLEPFSQFLLHQDFTGANLPTSPSFPTVWVPLTTGPHWGLRVYPGSHTKGILLNDFLAFEDARLEGLGDYVDVPAERGTALLFHALVLHGTINPGPSLRVSCDARFFPLCPFLGSAPWVLGDPRAGGLEPIPGDRETLAAARLETLAVLGRKPELGEVPPHSILNWVNYLDAVCRGDLDGALPHLERFVNPELTGETWEIYRDKYHGKPVHPLPTEAILSAFDAAMAEEHPRLVAV